MKKIFSLFTIFFLCFVTILPLPAYAGEKQEWTLVLKQGKAFFTVPFENDEPWKCVYKKTYNINSAKSSNKSVAVADIYRKHWLNIKGLKSGTAKITITCSGGYKTVINVQVKKDNIDKGTMPVPYNLMSDYKYFDYVGQSVYNGVAKDEYRIKSKYAICKSKINGMQPGDIVTARYGEYPVEYHNGGDDYITKTNTTSRYSLEFINSYRPSSKIYKGEYFDQLCKALTRKPYSNTQFKAQINGVNPGDPQYGDSTEIHVPYLTAYSPGYIGTDGTYGDLLGYHTWAKGWINVGTYCSSKQTLRYTPSSPFYQYNNGGDHTLILGPSGGWLDDDNCTMRVQSALMAFQYYSGSNFLQLVEFSDCHQAY